MNKIMSHFFIFMLILQYIVMGSASAGQKMKSVYIDPLFGGEESGPTFDQKHVAKILTLNTARRLKSLLEMRGIVSYLSRETDSFFPLEERLSKGIFKGAYIYIVISISRGPRNHILISHPSIENDIPRDGVENLHGVLGKLRKKSIATESKRLGELISNNLRIAKVPIYNDVQSGKNFILQNTKIITVVIEFKVMDSTSKSIYILDSVQMDKILGAIAEAVKKYISSP